MTTYSNLATMLETRDPAALDNLALLLQKRFLATETWQASTPPRVALLASACECLRLARKYRFVGQIALALRMEEGFKLVCWTYEVLTPRGAR